MGAKEVAKRVWRIADSDDGSILDIEQALRAYAESIREEAAKVAEKYCEKSNDHKRNMAYYVARAIRSLEIK